MSRITIKSLQATINNLQAQLEVARMTNDSYLVDSQTRDLQDIALKEEIARLKCDRAALSQDLLLAVDLIQPGFKGEISSFLKNKVMPAQQKPQNPQADKLVEGGRDPVVIHTDVSTVRKGMEWALQIVKFQSTVEPKFYENYVVSINKEGRWFAFLPLKESSETKAFAKEFVTAARAAGYEKANYKQGGGAWFIY